MMRQKRFTGKKHMISFAVIRQFRAGALRVFDKTDCFDGKCAA
jgi:hypothetical protein